MIKVIEPGIEALVTDLGRFGYYDNGLPPDGPMDNFSFRVGNILLGNDENAAQIGCIFMAPTLEVVEDTHVVFTGAECDPLINGEVVPMWQVHPVRKGDVISQDVAKSGSRVYVCFSGGIDTPLDYGSRSTYLIAGVGGYKGRALQEGDVLKLFPSAMHRSKLQGRKLEGKYIPRFFNSYELRVVPGGMVHEINNFDEFCEITWTVSQYFGRTAYRLFSPGFEYSWARRAAGIPQPFGAGPDPGNAVLNIYPVGAIQINLGNEAIVLLQDAVSAGGYVIIGTIVGPDQDIIGQGKMGDKIKFISVSEEQALEAYRERARLLSEIRGIYLV